MSFLRRGVVVALSVLALGPASARSAMSSEPAKAPAAGAAQGQADSTKAATPLGDEILLFERAVNWEVVSGAWVVKRPGWMSKVAAATDPKALALAVAELESHMGWESVNPKWRQRREGWLADAQKAGSMQSAARTLLELESMTLWTAVHPAWKKLRDPWVARVSQIAP